MLRVALLALLGLMAVPGVAAAGTVSSSGGVITFAGDATNETVTGVNASSAASGGGVSSPIEIRTRSPSSSTVVPFPDSDDGSAPDFASFADPDGGAVSSEPQPLNTATTSARARAMVGIGRIDVLLIGDRCFLGAWATHARPLRTD